MSGVEYIPHHFKHNAANTPDIHLERIVAIRKQAFRSPIPAECEHNLHNLHNLHSLMLRLDKQSSGLFVMIHSN